MSYDIGSLPQVQVVWTNLTGAATDSATTLTVTAPDGTTSSPAVTHASLGTYTATFPVTQAGTYLYHFATADVLTAVAESQITVRPSGVRLISLADAKAQLNITTTAQDGELADLIDSLTTDIEYVVGPVIPRPCTETLAINGTSFALSNYPAVSLTSITAASPYFIAPPLADLQLDGATGMVYRTSGVWIYGRFIAVYQAGLASIPPAVNEAARIVLQHQWDTQHNPAANRPVAFGEQMSVVPGMAYAIPDRAAEKLASARRISGFA